MYCKMLSGECVLSHRLKVDFFLLFCAVLLQQLHPIITLVLFIVIILRDWIHYGIYQFWNLTSILLLVTLISFFYNGVNTGNVTVNNAVWYTFPSFIALIIGFDFALKFSNQKQVFYFLFLVTFALALPHVLVTGLDIMKTGLVNPERTLSIYGDEDVQRAVTARTVELSLAISGISLFFVNKITPPRMIVKYFVCLSILAELCTLHYLSRTGIGLMFVALVFSFFRNVKLSGKTLLMILVFVVLGVILINSALFSLFLEREIDGSSISDVGGRTERWSYGLIFLLENPQGYHVENWYAHNFWLDFGAAGGLWSSILLAMFSLLVLKKVFLLSKHTMLERYNSFLLVLFEIIFFLTLFTEPVHSGAPAYMYIYFMIAGLITGLYKRFAIRYK